MNEFPTLNIIQLSSGYSKQKTIIDINLTAGSSECIAVTGSNGSGKSTLIKAIIGIIPILEGSISLGNWKRNAKDSPRMPKNINLGYLPQQKRITSSISVTSREIIESAWAKTLLHQTRKSKKMRLDELCDKLNIKTVLDKPYNRLSGGQMQKVLIARSLLNDPQVYLIDEPLTGLDEQSKKLFIDIVEEMKKRGAIILIVLHELIDFAHLITSELHLNNGKTAYLGIPDDCPYPNQQIECLEYNY